MRLADTMRSTKLALAGLGLATMLAIAPQAIVQAAAAPAAAAPAASVPVAPVNPKPDSASPATAATTAAKSTGAANDNGAPAGATEGYVPAKPVAGIGQPINGAYGFQEQFSPTGREALAMHNYVLMPLIVAISLFVLFLLLYVMARYNKRSNPTPSKNAHNTLIEVVWTLLPVLILVFVAVPSIRLLAAQYRSPPKNALTVKVTGYQWYWGYTYPDNGGFEVISNMLSEEDALKAGEPPHLGADKRMVVPYGEDIRIQTTGSDVIHSFAVPSLWFKLDAVPGRLNERVMHIDKPGVYYGQCSELCGARHGYMPIALEAVSRSQFEAWVKANGGTVGKPGAAATPAQAAAAPAIVPAAGASVPATKTPGTAPAAGAATAAPAAEASKPAA